MTDRSALTRVILAVKPATIFHLAGPIKNPLPEVFFRGYVEGTVALFEAIHDAGIAPTVVIASSSAIYGQQGGRVLEERTPPQPMTPYGASKLAQEVVAHYYGRRARLRVVIARLFNLIGPEQSDEVACSAFARQIALAERQGGGEVETGNLSSARDFVDVRDAAHALRLLAAKGVGGRYYNVCSGRATSLETCLAVLREAAEVRVGHRIVLGRAQAMDVPLQVGSFARINRTMGWRPRIDMRRSLTDLLDSWRANPKDEVRT